MWQPITQQEFESLYHQQEAELTNEMREVWNSIRTPLSKATIHRSDSAGDEEVFVVARNSDGILYFDDVEYGFNISTVDKNNVILQPGGSQFTLSEAVCTWLMDAQKRQNSGS